MPKIKTIPLLEAIFKNKGGTSDLWKAVSELLHSKQEEISVFCPYIKNKINSYDKQTSLLALNLLDFCVDNGKMPLWEALNSKEFLSSLVNSLKTREEQEIQRKILFLIQKWGKKFIDYSPDLSNFRSVYIKLKNNNITFPNDMASEYHKYVKLNNRTSINNNNNYNKNENNNKIINNYNQEKVETNPEDYLKDINVDLNTSSYEKKYKRLVNKLYDWTHAIHEVNVLINENKDGINNMKIDGLCKDLENGNKQLVETIQSGKLKDKTLMNISLCVTDDINMTLARWSNVQKKKFPGPFISSFFQNEEWRAKMKNHKNNNKSINLNNNNDYNNLNNFYNINNSNNSDFKNNPNFNNFNNPNINNFNNNLNINNSNYLNNNPNNSYNNNNNSNNFNDNFNIKNSNNFNNNNYSKNNVNNNIINNNFNSNYQNLNNSISQSNNFNRDINNNNLNNYRNSNYENNNFNNNNHENNEKNKGSFNLLIDFDSSPSTDINSSNNINLNLNDKNNFDKFVDFVASTEKQNQSYQRDNDNHKNNYSYKNETLRNNDNIKNMNNNNKFNYPEKKNNTYGNNDMINNNMNNKEKKNFVNNDRDNKIESIEEKNNNNNKDKPTMVYPSFEELERSNNDNREQKPEEVDILAQFDF